MKRNQILLIVITVLIATYCALHAFEFELRTRTEYWVVFVKLMAGLFAMILSLFLRANWWKKAIAFIALWCLFGIFIPETGLWNYSLNRYVKAEISEYEKIHESIKLAQLDGVGYISCRKDSLEFRSSTSKEVGEFERAKLPDFCQEISEIDASEIWIDNDQNIYLFAIYRFIDNGYGFLYVDTAIPLSEIYATRVNGLQITSLIKVADNWYYASFT